MTDSFANLDSVELVVAACETQPELRDALKAAATANQAAEVARQFGFAVTGADLLRYQAQLMGGLVEMDDAALMGVVGGTTLEQAAEMPFPTEAMKLI